MDPNGSETQTIVPMIGGPCDGVELNFAAVYGEPPVAGDFRFHHRRGAAARHLYEVCEGVGGVLQMIYRGAELVECTGK